MPGQHGVFCLPVNVCVLHALLPALLSYFQVWLHCIFDAVSLATATDTTEPQSLWMQNGNNGVSTIRLISYIQVIYFGLAAEE